MHFARTAIGEFGRAKQRSNHTYIKWSERNHSCRCQPQQSWRNRIWVSKAVPVCRYQADNQFSFILYIGSKSRLPKEEASFYLFIRLASFFNIDVFLRFCQKWAVLNLISIFFHFLLCSSLLFLWWALRGSTIRCTAACLTLLNLYPNWLFFDLDLARFKINQLSWKFLSKIVPLKT